MKKVLLLVTLFVTFLFSCKQTDKNVEPVSTKNKVFYKPSSYTGVQNNGEYLIFDTRANFESIVSQINNEEELIHFHDILKHRSKYIEDDLQNIEDTLSVDESLNAVLNSSNIVQVENHIFNLDFETNTIYALASQNVDELNTLKLKDTLNPNIKFFSMDYEAFELLDLGLRRDPSITNQKFFNLFRCRWAAPKNDNHNYSYGGGEITI